MTYRLAGVAALLAVVLTYSNHFRNDFHFDDAHTIQGAVALLADLIARLKFQVEEILHASRQTRRK